MDATQVISDPILSDDENEEENQHKQGKPLAKLCILKNPHIPETEFPLFLGDNVLGRDPSSCTLPLPAPSVSKQHAAISISIYRRRNSQREVDVEALIWDMGSMNGTRKGRLKLTPNVRYALSEVDSLVVADIPCQYLSCTSVSTSPKNDSRTPGTINSVKKHSLPEAMGEKGSDSVTDGEKSFSSETKTKRTPVRGCFLPFEQTPIHSLGTLVPESDSDSDGEQDGRPDRKRKTLVSDSDSQKSSPRSYAFMSPPSKVIPESDEEGLITPSSSAGISSERLVKFSLDKTDSVTSQKHVHKETSPGFVKNSEGTGEAAVLGETQPNDSGENSKEKNKKFSTEGISECEIPACNIDSDTDVEEEVVSALGGSKMCQKVNAGSFHLDSDTDVEGDENVSENSPNKMVSSEGENDPLSLASVVQPEYISMHSDSDVEADADVPKSAKSARGAPAAPSVPTGNFHLDSDTDVDEEDEERGEAQKESSIPDPSVQTSSDCASVAAAPGAEHGILSDSDTDVEAGSPLAAAALTHPSASSGVTSEAPAAGSDADTDVDEAIPADQGEESHTDVEDEKNSAANFLHLQRENTPASMVLLQKCSTPAQASEEVENMETQAFMNPLSGPYTYKEEDEDCAVAETLQAFGQTDEPSIRGDSSQVGLSDSSHLQNGNDALATESTQSYVVSLEETQPYATTPLMKPTQASAAEEEPAGCSEGSEKECCVNLAFEATQAYIPEPNYDSEDSNEDGRQKADGKETQPLDSLYSLALAETQPILTSVGENPIPISCAESVEPKMQEGLNGEEKHLAEDWSVAVTQPLCASESEEGIDDESVFAHLHKGTGKPLHLKDEQPSPITPAFPTLPETQPVCLSEGEEDDEESSMVLLHCKRKAKRLHIEDEESQQQAASETETQPLTPNEDDDDSEVLTGPRKRRARPLQAGDETQSPGASQTSALDSQPSEENRAAGSIRLPLEGEKTQPLISPEDVPPQLDVAGLENARESDSVPPKLTEKLLHLERNMESVPQEGTMIPEGEQIKPIAAAEAGSFETWVHVGESQADKDAVSLQPDEELKQSVPDVDASSAETKTPEISGDRISQPTETRLDGGEEQKAECSSPPKRQAQEECQILQSTRVHRGKAKSEDHIDECGLKQSKQTRGRKKSQINEQKGETKEKTHAEEESKNGRSVVNLRKGQHVGEEIKNQKEDKFRDKMQVEEAKETLREQKEEEETPGGSGRKKKNQEQPHEVGTKEEKSTKKQQKSQEVEVLSRGRRATKRTAGAELEQPLASRTRSRSNSSNSVSSERSASGVAIRGGRGRGAKRGSETPPPSEARSSRRRLTAAAGPAARDRGETSARGAAGSEASSSQTTARGARQQGGGRRTGADPPGVEESSQRSTRGRKSGISSSSQHQHTAAAVPTTTSRGQHQTNPKESEPSNSSQPKTRGQRAAISGNVEKTQMVSDGGNSRKKTKGRTSEIEPKTKAEADETSNAEGGVLRIPREERRDEQESPAGAQTRRAGRASTLQAEKKANMEKSVRGRTSAAQKSRKQPDQSETPEASGDQDGNVETCEAQTPAKKAPRKRQASSDSSPLAKTPRSASASPRLRAGRQTHKVLFTGVVDEAGEQVLARLGGSMAKGIADMNCLVTDKVRRTVKFLCAVAKGVPVVTPDWLEKSGKAGSFLSPHSFLVKDPEQEKKFSFCLEESLKAARSRPLLQGYEIHITKSVKPEPVHMKDIVSCSGATFLPKMPTSHKPQTVVISCQEDWQLCGPAASVSLPIVTAEFILTGILQQKVDLQTHTLSPEAGGRSKRKT